MSISEPLTDREREILTLMAEGQTNRQIAVRLFLSYRTVKWYNTQIYDKLGVRNRDEAIQQADALGLLNPPADETLTPARHNLPVLPTSFIGRAAELRQLAHLMVNPAVRLITILAPGGMGKTRFALEAARQHLKHFTDGVFFIPLAPLITPDDLVTTIAEYAGFSFYGSEPAKQQMLNYFRERNTLLLLDNFEHLLEGAALVSDLLQAAPAVTVLATSREKLNLTIETVFSLSGLHFPEWETPEDALEYDAVQVFMQRALYVRPDFELKEADLKYLARICRLTEGMPLGILLAAGWLDVLTLEQIAVEIQKGIDILVTELRDVPERQRSIRATFNHSWERLSETERAVFMKLSVFRGGFTAEAAQAVSETNIHLLRKLADKALIQSLPTGRYDIHELLRQYGAEKLMQSGEDAHTEHLYCTYFTDFLQARVPDIKGRRQNGALEEIESDWNNVRPAWQYAVAHFDYDAVDRMREALYLFCDLRVHFREGEELFLQAVDNLKPKDGEAAHPVWIKILITTAAVLLLKESPVPADQEQVAEILKLAEQHADVSEDPFYLWVYGYMLDVNNLDRRRLAFLKKSLSAYRKLGDPFYVARALRFVAFSYALSDFGYANEFEIHNHELLELTRATGDTIGMAHAIYYEGCMALSTNRPDEAERYFLEAEAIWQAGGDWKDVLVTKSFRAWTAFYKGDFAQARQLMSEAMNTALQLNYVRASYAVNHIRVISAIVSSDHQAEKADAVEYPSLPRGNWELAVAACVSGNIQAARAYMRKEFTTFQPQYQVLSQMRRELQMFDWLPVISIILAQDNQGERAVELLGMIYGRLSNLVGWLEQWPLIARLLAQLEKELGSEVYGAAWERGKNLDTHLTFVNLLEEFNP